MSQTDDWRCVHGHDRCDQMYPGPDCPYCERVPSQKDLDSSVFDGGAKDTGQRDVAPATEHTPGPWELGTVAIADRQSGGWLEAPEDAVVYCGSDEDPENECLIEGPDARANARLIAAAPDMYAQLDDALITLGEVAKVLARDYPSLANNVINQCAIRCADVLAKARGEK